MIDPIIEKLTKYEGDGEHDDGKCLDDVRVGMELLKRQYYPSLPDELKEYLWNNVRHDIIKEYFVENIWEESVQSWDTWKITWRE